MLKRSLIRRGNKPGNSWKEEEKVILDGQDRPAPGSWRQGFSDAKGVCPLTLWFIYTCLQMDDVSNCLSRRGGERVEATFTLLQTTITHPN